MKKKQFEYIAITVSMSFIMSMFLVFMFWWVYPYKTVDVKSQPYIVESKEIKIGGEVTYFIDYCKHTNKVPIVHKQFIDGIIYAIPESNVSLPSGCHKIKVSVKVPKTLLPGKYKLKVLTSFQMNPIRIITNEYETEYFSVKK